MFSRQHTPASRRWPARCWLPGVAEIVGDDAPQKLDGVFDPSFDRRQLVEGIATGGSVSRPIQKSRVVSSGIETAGIERIGSTRRGVLTTPWHAEDGPLMSGECCGGVPIRVFPPDGGPRASGCHGAAERRTASLEDGSFRAVRRSGWRRGRPVGGRRSGDWPGGCTGTRRARAQWRWRRCSTPPDCAAGSAPRRGSDPRRS